MENQPEKADMGSSTVAREKKNLALTVYILQALSLLIGITAFAGVIINYLKRDDVRGTYLASHFDWQIKTFWFTLLGSIIGILLLPVGVGGLVLLLVSLWFIYRIIKGWLVFNDGREIASGLF
jgi:uncharacterized membrane protein